eukprot:1143305-Pelagomonas_calceolata.AAC.7
MEKRRTSFNLACTTARSFHIYSQVNTRAALESICSAISTLLLFTGITIFQSLNNGGGFAVFGDKLYGSISAPPQQGKRHWWWSPNKGGGFGGGGGKPYGNTPAVGRDTCYKCGQSVWNEELSIPSYNISMCSYGLYWQGLNVSTPKVLEPNCLSPNVSVPKVLESNC